jgi:uncharacterized protein (DUF427 family)
MAGSIRSFCFAGWAAQIGTRQHLKEGQMLDTRPIKMPGPDHRITIERNSGHVVVMVEGCVIADTHEALTLCEAQYPPVQYIPRKDVDMTLLMRTQRTTYCPCPYKGDASYFSIPSAGDRSIDAVWSYETPYEAVAQIKDHLAFYPDRVDGIEVREGREKSNV